MRERQAEFKEVRPYFYEDFYPLSEGEYIDLTKDDVWLAYQLYRPSDDSGYVVAFRRKDNSNHNYTVKLRGLNAMKTYTLINKDTGRVEKKTGKELMHGLTLTLDVPQSSLLIKIQAE